MSSGLEFGQHDVTLILLSLLSQRPHSFRTLVCLAKWYLFLLLFQCGKRIKFGKPAMKCRGEF